jgi:hypothetical protein
MESQKRLKDLRGPQARVGRLLAFDPEAYIHMLSYRVMAPLTILYGILILLYFLLPGLGPALKIATGVVWVLWTPQFFAVARGLSLAWSRGMAFGRLNKEFADLYRKRYRARAGGYLAFPYLVLAAWVAGFIILVLRWWP